LKGSKSIVTCTITSPQAPADQGQGHRENISCWARRRGCRGSTCLLLLALIRQHSPAIEHQSVRRHLVVELKALLGRRDSRKNLEFHNRFTDLARNPRHPLAESTAFVAMIRYRIAQEQVLTERRFTRDLMLDAVPYSSPAGQN
jgi:hypothetical protein